MFELLVEDLYLNIVFLVGDCQWRLLQICHELCLHQGTCSVAAHYKLTQNHWVMHIY